MSCALHTWQPLLRKSICWSAHISKPPSCHLLSSFDLNPRCKEQCRACCAELHHAAQVQQEYHALFETSDGDPDAVMRWRNRAMRSVLPPETGAKSANQADINRPHSSSGQECASRCIRLAFTWVCTFHKHTRVLW